MTGTPPAGRSPGEDREEPGAGAGALAPSTDERAAAARARGLSASEIAGGRDPEPDEGRREERFYGRLLVAMVVVIVLSGFVLGIIGMLLGMTPQ